jgi:Gamma-glutamyl cyclotransferase, AIG2-like
MDFMQFPLFIYGSLLDPEHRARIIGRPIEVIPATLRGYDRGKRRYWFIRRSPGAVTPGALLNGLDAADLATLDAYEEVPELYTRERVIVSVDGGILRESWVFLPTGWAPAGSE